MTIDEQLVKINDYTIVFLSEKHFVITKDIDKVLAYEKVELIDIDNIIKKTRYSAGSVNFNVRINKQKVYVFINKKRMLLKDLVKNPLVFDNINLKDQSKILTYEKAGNIYVAISDNDFTYLNKKNIVNKDDLGNIFYFKDKSKNDLIEIQKIFNKLGIPFSKVVLDYPVDDNNFEYDFQITTKNNISPNNDFYFIENPDIKISNTNTKQIITSGFSRNNTLNYFDVNNSKNFNDIKYYIKENLNYNKNSFVKNNTKPITNLEFEIRLLQFNCFLQTSLVDFDKFRSIKFSEDDEYFMSLLRILNLRHQLTPFLYSAFKESRINNIDIYKEKNYSISIHNQLQVFPIYTPINKYTNQHFFTMDFDDIYYDFETEEKIDKKISKFYHLNKLPLYIKAGSIIPLSMLNNQEEIEILIYPNNNNKYTLHYDDYVVDDVIKHAHSNFLLSYSNNKLLFSIRSHSNTKLIPKKFNLNFVNIKSSSVVKVTNSQHKVSYNEKNKYLSIEITDTLNDIDIEITNQFDLELDRKQEFLEKNIERFFYKINTTDKEKNIFKYKIKPYLHESIDNLITRIEKNCRFMPKKQRKNLYKALNFYKK